MAAISINDVTTTLPSGNGVFDVLMRAIDAHLDKQYTSGRIKGSEYATVYLGALQAVLQQSISFVLQEQKVEKELDAVDAQIALQGSQKALVDQQKLTEIQNTAKATYEVSSLLPEQLTKLQEEVDLLQSQDLDVIATTAIKNAQSSKDLLVKQEQITASSAKTAQAALANTANIAVAEQQALNFKRDYKYKVMKAMLDIRSTGITQGLEGITIAAGDEIIGDVAADAEITISAGSILVSNG